MINWRRIRRKEHDKKRCNMVCQKALLWQIHNAGILSVEGVMEMDLIDRQDAIGAICSVCGNDCDKSEFVYNAPQDEQIIICPEHYALSTLPSAEPERLTDDDFETIRIHLNAFKERLCNQHRWKEAEDYERLINRFISFASAETECTCCEYRVGDLCCYSDVKTDMEAMEEGEQE